MLNGSITNKLKKMNLSIKLLIVILSAFLCVHSLKAQQESMYSQYMFNLLQINPAYAGNLANDNITVLCRKQWVGTSGSPATASLSWDSRVEGSNVGYGLQMYNDRLGIESTSGFQAFYSYRIPFRKSFLSFGLNAGVLYYRAAFSTVATTQNGDPLFQEDVSNFLPTVGVGALYATEHWYAALSVPALLKTKVNANNSLYTTSANNHYFLTGGYIFDASESVKLKPSVLLKAVKGAPLETDLNLNVWLQNIVGLGVSYRTGDSFVGMFEIQVSPVFRLGYAYDYTISNLQPYSKGTHELMLRYEINHRKEQRVLSPRYY